jgi:tripartite-type tricarboxylate transporter receptor subunit TctC
MNRLFVLILTFAACPALFAAESYPNRPIRMIVPLAPGGGMDTVARGVAFKLTDSLGQSVVIDNRSGGGGSIGVDIVTHAASDGYTLLMMSSSSVVYPMMYKARYDVVKDLAPISQVTSQPYVIVVNPTVPVKSVSELIAYAKSNPGKLTYASSGSGTLIHLATELFNSMAGTRMVHVPYRGIGAAYPDLFGGQLQLIFASAISAMPFIHSQRIRGIAVTSTRRAKALPDLPTVAQAGLPGYEVTQWYGVLGPAGTPPAIIDRLSKEIAASLQLPDMAARLAADGAEPVGGTPQQFAAHIKAERDKWTKVIKEAGIKGD